MGGLDERMYARLEELTMRAVASFEGRMERHLRHALEMGEQAVIWETVDADRGQRVVVVELAGVEIIRVDVLALSDRPDAPELN